VLFLFGRRCGPGEGLSVTLNTEDKKKGIERSLPRIEEAVDAGRLAAWVADKGGKVERLRTERPRVDWSKVASEVSRLAALAPADCEVEIGAAARRLGQRPGMLDLFVKFVRDQQCRWNRAPRFMIRAKGAAGQWILNSNVVLSGGLPLGRRLNTDDREVAAKRLCLLLWHAIAEGLLPGGAKHPAGREYGGPIAQEVKDLLVRFRKMSWAQYELERQAAAERLGYREPTLDWLTNHEEDRRQDPERRAKCDATLRSQERSKVDGKQTPISRSWQFTRVGSILHKHKGAFYGRVRIDGLNLEWPLGLQNRAEAGARVKPAIDAFELVGKTARRWREYPKGSREAKAASEVLLAEQGRLRAALATVGAKLSKNWAKAFLLFDELPFDESSRPNPEGCTQWFVKLLRDYPERQPRPLETVE
jgi:hypothetical protein